MSSSSHAHPSSTAAPRPLRTHGEGRRDPFVATSVSARSRFFRELAPAAPATPAPEHPRRTQALLSLLTVAGLVGLLLLGIALGATPGVGG